MKKISNFIKNYKFLIIILCLLLLVLGMIIYTLVTKYTVDSSKNKEQDVFDRLNSMNSQDFDDIGQMSLEGVSATYTKIDNVKCDDLKNAIVAYDEFFIAYDEDNMKANKVYRYNLQLLFKNEQNCILAYSDDSKDFKSLLGFKNNYNASKDIMITTSEMDDRPIRYYGNDPQLPVYYFASISNSIINHYIPYYTIDSFSSYRLNNKSELIKNPSIIYQVANSKAIIKGNIMYKVYLKENYLTIYDLNITDEIVFEPKQSDEIILKVFTSAIITDKRVYVYGMIDDSCLKYVDQKCENGFVINEDLTKRINDIAIIDSTGVVFKDGSAYLYENVRGEV